MIIGTGYNKNKLIINLSANRFKLTTNLKTNLTKSFWLFSAVNSYSMHILESVKMEHSLDK